jgi:hypothetical protein
MSWIIKNNYLTQSEMENNALEFYGSMNAKGWSINAISGILGNLQEESNINPGLWESLTVDYNRGYGLTQWTPATKYIDWAGVNYESGERQCERIQYECDINAQWFYNPQAPFPEPPITFKEFSTSTLGVDVLANYFLWYYEHPANINQPSRALNAGNWYTFLTGHTPPTPQPTNSKKMPLYMMTRLF